MFGSVSGTVEVGACASEEAGGVMVVAGTDAVGATGTVVAGRGVGVVCAGCDVGAPVVGVVVGAGIVVVGAGVVVAGGVVTGAVCAFQRALSSAVEPVAWLGSVAPAA